MGKRIRQGKHEPRRIEQAAAESGPRLRPQAVASEPRQKPQEVPASEPRRTRRGDPVRRTRGLVVGRILMALCLVVGLACLLYPLVGTYLNERSFSDAVARYEENVSAIPEAERLAMLDEARAYNESLRGDPVRDPFVENSGYAVPSNYNDVLDVDGEGLMGTVSIPAIGIQLPVYHGTSDDVLAHGAGHIPQTSLPVGGAGTHAVITGHTGLPTARLFSDLEQLEIGDVFVIEVLGEKHAYAVDDIRIVEPDEVSSIRVDTEHDYVTLLTCTPYGVNSHRLLVRGSACDVPAEGEDAGQAPRIPFALGIGVLAVGTAFAVGAVIVVRRKRKDTEVRSDEA